MAALRSLLTRLFTIAAILVGLSAVLFGLLSAMPGDPVEMLITANPRVKPEDVARLKRLRGLDQPWYIRYVRWAWGYHQPQQPPEVHPLKDIVVVAGDGPVSFDVAGAVADRDVRLDLFEARSVVEQAAGPGQVDLDVDEPDALLEQAQRAHPAVWRLAHEAVRAKMWGQLRVEPLFGAEFDERLVGVAGDVPAGIHRVWFLVRDTGGLEGLGQGLAYVAPPFEPELTPEEAGTDEEQRQSAGSTEAALVDERGRTALIADATDAGQRARFAPLDVVVAAEDGAVTVDVLAQFSAAGPSLTGFRLVRGPGTITAGGVYRHRFAGPGQTVVAGLATDDEGGEHPFAFAVDHGPVPDPDRFERGFVFALLGDSEALGFSNLYKRPVAELLGGSPDRCGDGVQDIGESCDDANRKDGDGCSATCHDESAGMWQAVDDVLAGKLYRAGRVLNTLLLMIPALLLSLLFAIPAGIYGAVRQYSAFDYVASFLAFVGISLFVAWFGLMAMAVFSEQFHWFPAGGIQTPGLRGGFVDVVADRLSYTVLPAGVLSIAYAGAWLRYMRGAMLEVLPADYIRTARAKGLPERTVVVRHAVRNALIPVVTVVALSVPRLFGGALLTEQVFSWPGIGRLQFEAVMGSDYYVAIVVFLISAALVMVGNLLADAVYVLLDPRLRRSS